MQRNAMYRDKECQSLKQFEADKAKELAQLRAELAAKENELARPARRAGEQGEPRCLKPIRSRSKSA